MRVYNWDQILDHTNYIPANFTEPFYAVGTNNGGFNYTGTVTVTNAFTLGSVSYSDDVRWVIVQVRWRSGAVERRREMRTLVSQHGLHQYVY
jgi:hypothetical protein